ncbi:carbohydrate esterase family 4 protein [Mycena rebaudengoi]|nr:carbohydrate esterase family 4 protein [Mycena rebaudengoi]
MFTKARILFLGGFLASAQSLRVVDRATTPNQAIVYTSCKVPGTAAVTFDDGPWIHHAEISDLLLSKGAKGTFFVNGYNYDCIYDADVVSRLQQVYTSGHQIASHTWSHPDLAKMKNASQIQDEYAKIDTALYKILGIKTQFIRPPYGSYSKLARQVAFQMDKCFVTWDFDSGDSVGATLAESEDDYDRAVAGHPVSLLTLNHETVNTTASSLAAYAINVLQAAGLSLVTVADCLGLPAYTSEEGLGKRDTTWFCPEDN